MQALFTVSQTCRLRTIALFALLITSRAAGAPTDWNVRVWQPNDASPNSKISGVVQTQDGYLWVGTPTGLSRFDGVKFEQCPLTIPSESEKERVAAITKTHAGGLLVASETGRIIEMDFGRPPKILGHLPNFQPEDVVEDGQQAIWVSSRAGQLARILDQKITEFSAQDGVPNGRSTCNLIVDINGSIWFAKGAQIGIFRDGRFNVLAKLPQQAQLTAAHRGGVWITSDFALSHCDENGDLEDHGSFKPKHAIGNSLVMLEDHNGAVWIGTSAYGLFRYDGKTFENVPTSFHRMTSLTEDSDGNLWVGTQGGGLNRVQPRAIMLEGGETGLMSQTVMSLCEDTEGTFWAAMQDGSLKRRTDGQWINASLPNPWSDEAVISVASDRDGKIWVGGQNGRLFNLQHDHWASYSKSDGLAAQTISKMLVTKNGDLWIVAQTPDTLQRVRAGKFQTFTLPALEFHVRALAEDGDGNIWIASERGKLWRITNDNVFDETSRLPKGFVGILCLYANNNGTIWIGTAQSGLFQLQDGNVKRIDTRQGLYSNCIAQIIPDERGWVWFGASNGIFKVRERELADVADGKQTRLRSMHYGLEEGLPTLQTTVARCNAVRGHDGHLWLIMGPALVTISPEKVREQLQPPPVILEKVLVDDNLVASYAGVFPSTTTVNLDQPTNPVQLPPDHHRVQFDFTALSFNAPSNVQFQYQLQNFDDRWIDGGAQREVTYSRLPPGDYQFAVRACNSDGVWNEAGAKLAFTVVPGILQTTWFRLGAVGLFTTAVVALARYISFRRLRAQVRSLERQTAIDRERTRIARDLHDELGAGLTSVAMLGDMALRHRANENEVRAYAQQITSTSRQIMKSLDETVWAVHPRNDTLEHLLNYLGKYALEFLDSADVRCRMNLVEDAPRVPVTAEVRHNVLLVVKEALNNVVRHSHASEVRIHVGVNGKSSYLSIEDNGCGFNGATEDVLADGLHNMRQRMADIDGRFEINSEKASGTKIFLSFPCRSAN
ncbi:MAG TPA: two-component regulator propeller domain-containing protein [Pirellulales bacterium]|jgi:signal transduction histidine kinase/ligand-binding sensor domain-containing protein|nr:two-component regulator propeller domain-containing protein [Pirellulales bacterium]